MNLKNFITENYPAKVYLNLNSLLGLSKKKTTLIINNPSSMEKDHVKHLSVILELEPTRLINEFNCGRRKMNLEEADELMELKEV